MNVHASLGRLALGGQPDRSSAPTRAAASVAAAGRTDEAGRPAGWRAGRRELSTQAHLVALVAAILLPLLLGSGALLWRYAKAERVRQHQDAQALALELVGDVDRELDGTILALRALATSPALQAGDLAAFDAQARAVVAFRGESIVLRDAGGRQVVNPHPPGGTPRPATGSAEARAADTAVRATGQPYVSDLATATLSGRHLLFVDVPVRTNGATYTLGMCVAPEDLSTLLAAGGPTPEGAGERVRRGGRG